MTVMLCSVLFVGLFSSAVLAQTIEERLLALEQENVALKLRFNALDGENNNLRKQVEHLKERMDPSESKPFLPKRQTIPEQVAFHAFQVGNKCMQNKQTFVYEHAPINEGNGYSSSDGIFDAPLSGLYMFTWTVADYHDWYATELIADGVSRGATIADNGDSDISTGTAIVLVKLNAGSHAFVRRSTGGGCNVVNIADQARNSFSGWLLFPTET